MNKNFLICDYCKENQTVCKQCHGRKVVIFFKKYVLSFTPHLKKKEIITNKINRTIDILLFYVLILFGITGILSLFVWFYINIDFTKHCNWKFWERSSYYILWFYFGIFSFAFAFFKKRVKVKKEYKINKFPDIGDAHIPDNWNDINYYTRHQDVSVCLSLSVEKILEDAYLLAEKNNNDIISPVHLLYIMLKNSDVIRAIFIRLNIDLNKLKHGLEIIISRQEHSRGKNIYLSVDVRKIFLSSFIDAYQLQQKNIDVLNVLEQCGENNYLLKELFLELGIKLKDIHNVIEWIRIDRENIRNMEVFRKMARLKPETAMNRSYTALATPLLNTFSYDLTLAAKWGRLGICIKRDVEINEIFETMSGSKKGVILVGSPGVGKRTIVEGIARLMTKEDVPLFLQDKRLISLDIGRMISGADASMAEKRLLSVLDEITMAGNIVLHIGNIDSLSGIMVGGDGSLSILRILSDALRLRNIYCLASSTIENYANYLENSPISSYMEKILIEEPLPDDAICIVENKVGVLEYKYKNIFYSYGAIETSVKASTRLIHDKYLPQKAIDILEKTGARVSASSKEGVIGTVGRNEVLETLEDITGVPTEVVTEEDSKVLLNLEHEIHKYMVNQKEAVSAVSNSLRRARVNLKGKDKTISNFLFLGPTGVGKTELAKVVTNVYFRNKKYMLRFDMSEYQHIDSVKKMIGSADGARGILTEKIRKQPYSLVLLDEFEKAHPKILDLFLQIMDDGRLTSADGTLIDFTNTIIIATSNAGALYIRDKVREGANIKEIKEGLINKELNKIMKPELLNRFDEIVVFKPLTMDNVIDITRLMLRDIEKMLNLKNIFLQAREAGIIKLAKEGYNPDFGARSLKRVLQRRIENEIAKKILEGSLNRRDTVVVNSDGNVEVQKAGKI